MSDLSKQSDALTETTHDQLPSTEHNPDAQVEQEAPLVEHLRELRDRIVKALVSVVIAFVVLFPFSNTLYSVLADPLMSHMPEGTNMIAIDVASPFLIPLKLTLMVAVMVAIPWVLYQIWAFIAPGLYQSEKRLVMPLVASSTALFYLGVLFAYFVVFPLVFGFFTSVGPDGVEVSTDIGRYLDFVVLMFFAFGITFEVPIATYILIITGVASVEKLKAARPYLVVAAFVIGSILTPPDLFSQTLLALPMWLLFEIGLLAGQHRMKSKEAGV
ncbi:MAG: twin-arginine translocase subunit TatC [Gammaproteobacteria bacterium]|nr:twin-arginine translocase subunit TatC [Gammaproteobacteria bacterium]